MLSNFTGSTTSGVSPKDVSMTCMTALPELLLIEGLQAFDIIDMLILYTNADILMSSLFPLAGVTGVADSSAI